MPDDATSAPFPPQGSGSVAGPRLPESVCSPRPETQGLPEHRTCLGSPVALADVTVRYLA